MGQGINVNLDCLLTYGGAARAYIANVLFVSFQPVSSDGQEGLALVGPNTPCQHTLSTHHLNILCDIPYQSTPSTHTINPPPQPYLFTHLCNPPYQQVAAAAYRDRVLHKHTLADLHESCAAAMRVIDADRMDDIAERDMAKGLDKKGGGKVVKKEEDGMLPEVSIKIPLRVPPKLLLLMCDMEQHQNDLRESVRNLVIQVGLIALL